MYVRPLTHTSVALSKRTTGEKAYHMYEESLCRAPALDGSRRMGTWREDDKGEEKIRD